MGPEEALCMGVVIQAGTEFLVSKITKLTSNTSHRANELCCDLKPHSGNMPNFCHGRDTWLERPHMVVMRFFPRVSSQRLHLRGTSILLQNIDKIFLLF